MKLVKIIGVLVVAVGFVAILFWQFMIKDQVDYARVATAYGAKMVCSCRFVAERPMQSCVGDFTSDISQVSFRETDRTVRASVLGGYVSAEARHAPGLGCTLVNPD